MTAGGHVALLLCPPYSLARGGAVRRKGFSRITLEELVDAGEAMLLEMVRLARRTLVGWAKRLSAVAKSEGGSVPTISQRAR